MSIKSTRTREYLQRVDDFNATRERFEQVMHGRTPRAPAVPTRYFFAANGTVAGYQRLTRKK